MKKIILTLISLLLVFDLFSQNQPVDKSKEMKLIPSGSFQMKTFRNSQPRIANVTVESFWMSNEVTNAEYREFVDWAEKHPDQKFYQINFWTGPVSDAKKGTTKDTTIRKIVPIEVSSIISEIIDTHCLDKVNNQYKDYFTNPAYNDFPVVGVSFKMAQYYCIWKTTMENDKLKERGLPEIPDYRIPLESQWEYVAQQKIISKTSVTTTENIQKVSEGNVNEFGLLHLDDNVSEWVTPRNGEETGLMRGGSWKSGSSISERQTIDPNSKEPFIGFRIVQANIKIRDYKKLQ